MNKEFGALLMLDLGRQVMVQNKLSIHVESGENHNTDENFYNFLLAQQNDDAAFIPKKFSYHNSFETYISQFVQAFSIDDVEKYDLYAHKNSKYLFYRFNDYIKAYGNSRQKIKHTRKMSDSIGMQKIGEESKQFLVEKIIHGIKFKNPYNIETEKKPEIIENVESNYKIARRVYQQLYVDISELSAEFIRSIDLLNLQDMDDDIKANSWGIKKISDVNNAEDFMTIFQTFYQLTGRLPLSNGLLVIPDGDPPPGENRVNMKSLYEMFKHTNSHGLVSVPFLGLIQYYLLKNDFSLIKNARTELYSNLSYITLSGAREFDFNAVSNLTARLSFLLKQATITNLKETEKSHRRDAYNINKGRLFEPKIEDPLDTVIEILDDPYAEHKKEMYPYVPPQVQTTDEIETETTLIDDEFTDLKTKYDEINDVATEQKKQQKITDLVDDVIDESNPF